MDGADIDVIFQLIESAYRYRQSTSRPWITLTWAQSLDGKLSTSQTKQTMISGEQSMGLTHGLRALHQAILVGSNTAIVDNPRLSARLSPTILSKLPKASSLFIDSNSCSTFEKGSDPNFNPVPIILDSRRRVKPTARFLQTPRKAPGKPFIFCAKSHKLLTQTSMNVIPVPTEEHSAERDITTPKYLSLYSVVEHLRSESIKSVMVEGGASVLSSFLAEDLWDIAIVTIAPAIFGGGPSLQPTSQSPQCFAHLRFAKTRWFKLGNDIILVGFPDRGL